MQYILTQAEYDALTPVKGLQERNEALEVAREMIVKLVGINCGKEYCDLCPISHIGQIKGGAKRPTQEISRHICMRARHYSK